PPVSETKTPETKQPEQTTSDQKTADQPKTVVPDSTSPKQPLSHTEKPTTATTDPGAGSDSFIIADSVDGTKVVKSEKAKPQKPEPATGTGTIKVYPPDGH
ncbi:MAG TPA: hypothetical protein VNI20_01040, partial [Fimbriimonadaceae bacterium]|nr:hypothetical protein [Fimbriimonadaceae bacterium]